MNVAANGRTRSGTTAVALLAAVVRIVVAAASVVAHDGPSAFWAPDTHGYVVAAEEMVRRGEFVVSGLPELRRTPGYPLLLAPGVALGHVEAVTVALQIALAAATAALVYRLAMLLWGRPNVALACGVLYAVEPVSVMYSVMLLSETLFAFLLVVVLHELARYEQRPRIGRVVAAGAALAAAVYVRPIAYYLPLVVAPLLVLRRPTGAVRRTTALAHAVVFLWAAMAPVGVWQLRNYVRTGYAGFSAIADINWYYYQAAAVAARLAGRPYLDVQRDWGYADVGAHCDRDPVLGPMTWAQRYAELGHRGRQLVAEHPATFARVHAAGMVRTLVDPGAAQLRTLVDRYPQGAGLQSVLVDRGLAAGVVELCRQQPLLAVACAVLGSIGAAYYGLALVATMRQPSPRRLAIQLAAIMALYLLIMSGGPNAYHRFRHGAMPMVCLAAGLGLAGRRAEAGARVRQALASPGGCDVGPAPQAALTCVQMCP